VKAWCLISRHGFVHCVVRALKIGDQYAVHAASLVSLELDPVMCSTLTFATFKMGLLH
jgi:hypothetical protein